MERRGSGIIKMPDAYKDDKKKPTFRISEDAFIVIFYSRLYRANEEIDVDENVGENVGKKNYLNDTQKSIIKLIIQNKYITQEELANRLNITKRTIERNVSDLKNNKVIERI